MRATSAARVGRESIDDPDRYFARRSNPRTRQQLAEYARLFEGTLRQERGKAVCLCGMLASEIATLDDDSAAAIRKFYRHATAALVQILRTGIQDKSLTLDSEPESVGEMIFSMLQGTLVTCRVSGGAKRFQKMTQQLLQLFITNK